MSKIRILPEQLANQIAAGEVVERPASVVKELVENSLDAGASRIEIEIEGGGTRLIRIIDDGEGMSEDDLLLCLERHGTSKIEVEEDLGAIMTLGFRGEAVPSIGSVSNLTISSRPADSPLGTQVILKYGKLTKVHETGCSFGTSFEVRNLFGNTPARRKFLRTSRTELGHIEEVVKNYSLGAPEITFILRVDGRDVLYLDSTLSLEQRLNSILRYKDTFIPVHKELQTGSKTRATGFLVPPDKVKPGPARLRIFVNGRAVKDRMVVHAIAEGLRGFLMKGNNPSGLIHVQLPAEEVDVNVHPAKHEVRFRNSREIHNLISQSISEAMLHYQQTVKATIFGKSQQPARAAIPEHGDQSLIFEPPPPTPETRQEEIFETLDKITHNQEPINTSSSPQTVVASNEPGEDHFRERQNFAELQTKEPEIVDDTPSNRGVEHNLLIIGQFDDLYIFCKSSEGLLVIDQHAAHERLLYEKLRHQYLENSIVRQNLMFPETIELSLFQSQLVEKNSEELDRMGFSIREFGGNTFLISAIPALAGQINPHVLFLDILEQFGSESRKRDQGGVLDTILSTMACRAAVKAGTNLTHLEIDKLLNDMVRADLFSHCPHGRPVIKQFSKDDLKKWFHRT